MAAGCASSTAAALVSNGPAIDPELGMCPSEIGVQYQPDGRLSTFPKNTATFTGKLLIVFESAHDICTEYLCLFVHPQHNLLLSAVYLAISRRKNFLNANLIDEVLTTQVSKVSAFFVICQV
jgi:hypothetical protein